LELAWVLWTGTAFVAFVVLLRVSHRWLPIVRAVDKPTGYDRGLLPTVEMLEQDRRETALRRLQLIHEWRELVSDVTAQVQQNSGWDRREIVAAIQKHKAYPSMHPYLEQSSRWMGRNTTVLAGDVSSLPHDLRAVLDVIADKEKEWKLH
jgi:hypothetical protein